MRSCCTDSKGNPSRLTSSSLLSLTLFLIFFSSLSLSPLFADEASGVYSPSERPRNAPFIKEYLKGDSYFDNALKGVTKPYPPSLMFLQDQGAWYTPFNHPGMLGRFDIRGWHQQNNNNLSNNNASSSSVEPSKDTAQK